MSEPFYIAQTAERMSVEDAHAWIKACAADARERGATHLRASVNSDCDFKIYLVEGWRDQPSDEGEPRWQLTKSLRGKSRC